VLGDLAQTTAGTWIAHPPTRCPNGHPLGPGEVLVGEIGVEGGGDGDDVAGAGGENVGIGRGRVVLLGEVSGTDDGDSVVRGLRRGQRRCGMNSWALVLAP
jgi:hypothetical protein